MNHRRREKFPTVSIILKDKYIVEGNIMKELSVFIDESEDFGELNQKNIFL